MENEREYWKIMLTVLIIASIIFAICTYIFSCDQKIPPNKAKKILENFEDGFHN